MEFTSSILVHLCEIQKTQNGENKENEPNRNEPIRTDATTCNGIANTDNDVEHINTEIEIDAISSIENNEFEIQNIGTVDTIPVEKETEVNFNKPFWNFSLTIFIGPGHNHILTSKFDYRTVVLFDSYTHSHYR